MGVPSGNHGGSYGALQESRSALEAESGKLFTRKVAFLILTVVLLLPFAYARLFISDINILPTAHYIEQLSSLPSSASPSTSLPVKTAPAYGHEKQHAQDRQPQKEEEEDDDDDGEEAEGGNYLKQPDEHHHHQEQQDAPILRKTHQQQELQAEGENYLKQPDEHHHQERQDAPILRKTHQQQERRAEGENYLKQLDEHHHHQEQQDAPILRKTHQQQERHAEEEKYLKQPDEHHHRQERKDVPILKKTHKQQEHVDLDDPTQLINASIDNPTQLIDFSVGGCKIWKGKWIPHHSKPAYTNATCRFIQGHQNCMSNGRPDRKYLQWRWKPHDCELPLFDAKKFLKLVRGKAWAFVGDSISRNHFQSVLCFLAQVELPRNMYNDDKDWFVRWLFPSYNFTLAAFWSPFLIHWMEGDVKGFPSGTEQLHLDKVDKNWVSSLADYDYLVLAAGHWFFKSSIYFSNNELIGCHYCPGTNCTQLGYYYGFRTALRTVYDFLVSSNYRGIVFFRTFTPEHFENGQWYEGGNCMRTMPTHNATLSAPVEEMYKIQLEEFGRTLQMHSDWRGRLKIVDTIHASLVRADGHPGPYRSVGSSANDLPQDCLHWCLPGPIDTWSAMLLEMLRHM